jgi:hypothetical protein
LPGKEFLAGGRETNKQRLLFPQRPFARRDDEFRFAFSRPAENGGDRH